MALWQAIKKYLSPTVKGRLSYTSIKQERYNSMRESNEYFRYCWIHKIFDADFSLHFIIFKKF